MPASLFGDRSYLVLKPAEGDLDRHDGAESSMFTICRVYASETIKASGFGGFHRNTVRHLDYGLSVPAAPERAEVGGYRCICSECGNL